MLKDDSIPANPSPTGGSRSRWALLAIAYLPAALALVFTFTSAFLLWRARTDALAAMEEQHHSMLLTNQIAELARSVNIASALAQESISTQGSAPVGSGRRLALKHCKDQIDSLSKILDSGLYEAPAAALRAPLRVLAKNMDILAGAVKPLPNHGTGGKEGAEGALTLLFEELGQSLEQMKAASEKRHEAAIAHHADQTKMLTLFERVFVSCSLLFIGTIFITGRSLARYVKGERAAAARQQSFFDAANRTDLQAKQTLLDSIQNAQSRYIASGDLLPVLEGLLADLLRLSGSDFGFISEVQANPTNAAPLGAREIKNVFRHADNSGAHAAQQPSAEELQLLNLLTGPSFKSKEPLIFNHQVKEFDTGIPWPEQLSLNSLLVLPVLHGNEIIGVVGIANRAGGYNAELAYFLLPLVSTCGKLFQACLNERSQQRANLDRQKFVFLVENSTDCIGMATLDGRMFFLNAAGRRLLGLAADTPIALTCLWDFYFEGGERFFQEKALPSLKSTGRWEGEVMVRNIGSQEAIAVFQNVYLVSSDDNSEPLYVAVVNRDIRGNKRAASALNLAKEAAEAASRSKSEFLANMSHEVRTPMVAILGFSEMLLDPDLQAEERKRAIQDISRNGKHLLQVINDILDLSKIEAGKLSLEFVSYSPWQIVLETISALRAPGDEKRVRLEAAPVGKLPRTIRTDPRRVRQILFNLVSNALKFTEANRRVAVTLAFDKSEQKLCFDVTDEGIGITESQMGRLFFPFEQGDSSTTRRFGGTGLGLSISRRLAQMMGGDIVAKSNPGEGSRFVFELPIEAARVKEWVTAEALSLESIVDVAAERSPALTSCSGRILLAEDNPSSQRVIEYALQKAGLEVETAANGKIAVQKAMESPFDLILMDMQMPEMDGYGATAALRKMGCQCPIIALTAHAMRGDREKCNRAGCDDYLTKPVESHKLIATIVRYLAMGPSHRIPADVETDSRVSEREAPIHIPQELTPIGPPGGRIPRIIPNRIRSAYDNDKTMLPLIAEYVAGLRQHVADLHKAIDEGDVHRVITLAHQTKGAGGMYGYTVLSEAAGSIEAAARKGASSAELQRLWDAIDAIAHAVQLGMNDVT